MTERTYTATVLQPALACVGEGGVARRDRLMANARHCADLVERAARERPSALYVLPQFVFQGSLAGLSREGCLAASIALPGPESAVLAAAARAARAYVAAATCEVCAAFPGRYFQTGFVIDPAGELVLVTRKHYAMTLKTRPGDVLDAYVAAFGADALFPVVATPFGRVGVAVGGDVNWPEVVRCLALRGAELVLNPICAGPSLDHLGRSGGEAVRSARAFENGLYVLTSNLGGLDGDDAAPPEPWSASEIHDFTGRSLVRAPAGRDTSACATIDPDALRRQRGVPSADFVAQLQAHLHVPEYTRTELWPPNLWADRPPSSFEDLRRVELQSSARVHRPSTPPHPGA